MDVTGWVLFGLAALVALGVIAYLYGRRETPGRGRWLLAGLRFVALALVILLLFDPDVPARGWMGAGDSTRVLVDGSLSMGLPAEAGAESTRWERAVAEAQRLARGGEVVVFGEEPRIVRAEDLTRMRPEAGSSRLAPAVQAAAEAGARRILVLTDEEIEDPVEVAGMATRLGVGLELRRVAGPPAVNRSLAEVEAPAWAEAGQAIEVRVAVTATGPAGDSVEVVVREGERVRAATRVALAEAGRLASATLRFEPEAPAGGGLVRYDVELAPGDVLPDDDRRSVYIHVGERPAGLVLVSFRPDWEPRFLQPVLERALGLPVRGFLRAQGDRYTSIGAGLDASRVARGDEVRRAARAAGVVVLHGLGPDAPDWAAELAEEGRRVLVFPDAAAARAGPVRVDRYAPGDWFPTADVPASPVASLLAGIAADALPPLPAVRAAEAPPGSWTPLLASRDRRGQRVPLLLAGERGGRRWAVALGEGYWQWAFRGGESRQIYQRLWSALAGWLGQEERAVAAGEVRAARRIVARGEPIPWLVGTLGADSIGVRVVRGGADPADAEAGDIVEAMLPVVAGDSATLRPLPPGHYRYAARAFAGDSTVAAAEGEFTVESYSPEFHRTPVTVSDAPGVAAAAGVIGRAPGQPLHTLPWPYLALALLLAAEWILRRRWGLR